VGLSGVACSGEESNFLPLAENRNTVPSKSRSSKPLNSLSTEIQFYLITQVILYSDRFA